MGLFDELDIAGAADDPYNIPDNTYQAVVSDLLVKADKNGNMGMTFIYTIQGGTEQDGLTVSEYKRMPSSKDAQPLNEAEKNKAMSYIKMRLASLGIPEARMNSVDKSDLVGIQCFVTTKKNGDYTNVRNVSLTTSIQPATATAGATANPFG